MQGPSRRQLAERLLQARDSIEKGLYDFADQSHVIADIVELELENIDEYVDVIWECINIALKDPAQCHRPPNEPVSTAHDKSKNLVMNAFRVKHSAYKKDIYFKFCLSEQTGGTWYIHIDCHLNRN